MEGGVVGPGRGARPDGALLITSSEERISVGIVFLTRHVPSPVRNLHRVRVSIRSSVVIVAEAPGATVLVYTQL